MLNWKTHRKIESHHHIMNNTHQQSLYDHQAQRTAHYGLIRYNLPVDTAKTFPVIDQLTLHTGDSKLRIRTDVHSPPT